MYVHLRRLPRLATAGAVLAVVTLAVGLTACSSSKHSSSFTNPSSLTSATSAGTAATSSSTNSTQASKKGSGNCGSAKAGQGGVIQVFCDGPAVAKVTVGGASKTLTGGSCTEQSGLLAINFGVVAGPDYPSGQAKPDYLGAGLPDGSSNPDPQAFSVHINGVGGNVVHRTSTISGDKKTITLGGQLLSGETVAVDVTC